MTRVTIYTRAGAYEGYDVHGHAGYAIAGEDVVCAAVSCLTFTCVNAMEDACGAPPVVDADDKTARLSVSMPPSYTAEQRESARAMMRFMVIGLADLAAQYPQYLTLTEIEKR